MRFTALSTAAVAGFMYSAMATPIAEPLPVELIERQSGVGAGSCIGPIVNVVTYTAEGCTNDGTTSQNFNILKFAPIPTEPNRDYQSSCQRVNTPTDTAKSYAFISDDFKRNCYLVTYEGDNCGSEGSRTQSLDFGYSRCINENVGSVKVYCLASRAPIPRRDVEDPETDGDDEGTIAQWSKKQ